MFTGTALHDVVGPVCCGLIAAVLSSAHLAAQTSLGHTVADKAGSALDDSVSRVSHVASGPLPSFGWIHNDGQWPPGLEFASIRSGTRTAITRDGVVAMLPGTQGRTARIGLSFLGASPVVDLQGVLAHPTSLNFFLGNDPARWKAGVSAFREVRMPELYDGVDVVFREPTGSMVFEFDYVVRDPAALDGLALGVSGAPGLRIEPDGSALIETEAGVARLTIPVAEEVAPSGARTKVGARFRLDGPGLLAIDVDGWSGSQPLVIDPGLEWSTLLGGQGDDVAADVTIAPDGGLVVVGSTGSVDFPVTPGAFDTSWGCGPMSDPTQPCDAFVARLSADMMNLEWATFIGGKLTDRGRRIKARPDGTSVVALETGSADYPVTPGAFNQAGANSINVSVLRLSATGTNLVYSALVGGTGVNQPKDFAFDAAGNTLVVGTVSASGFPITPGTFQPVKAASCDGFVFSLSEDGSRLIASTFLGDSAPNAIQGVAVEESGSLLVAMGGATDGNLPTHQGTFDPMPDGSYVTYIARFTPDLSTITHATYLGGSLGARPRGLAVGPLGRIYVTGFTYSFDFPVTPGAFQTVSLGSLPLDSFVTCFDSELSSLVYSTYLTAGKDVTALSILVDDAGMATVAGFTLSPFYPTTKGAFQETYAGVDYFISRLAPDGSTLYYSTYLGGSYVEAYSGPAGPGANLATDAYGSVVLAGSTKSTDYPASGGAFQPGSAGKWDAVVTRLDMLPTGVTRLGQSTPGCAGLLAIGVTAIPSLGNPTFGLTCTNAPVNSGGGLLAVSLGTLASPVAANGTSVWIDPTRLVALLPASADATGFARLPARIPENPVFMGLQTAVQFFWPDPCAPAGWSASNALGIVLQS